MDITFTAHAEWRLTKRKILRGEVLDAIKYPDIILKKYGKYYYQKQLNRGAIEIVCEKIGKSLNIITLYWL